jgi:outer membrane lipoprotein LolB
LIARGVFAWLVCGLLAGCAAGPSAPPALAREAIAEFSLLARLSITHGEERVSVAIDWQHQPAGDDITVRSPIGQVLAQLTASANGARLETAQQRVMEAPTLDDLSERALGVSLPLSGLPDWVLGRPSGLPQHGERDALGRWARFVEEGWQVVFAEYESGTQHALPRLIHLTRGAVAVRLRADQWQVR